MSGIDLAQLKYLIVEPALMAIGLMSTARLNLVCGTALCESGAMFLHQVDGPALGPWQTEQATEADCWTDFLSYRHDLAARVRSLLAPGPSFSQLVGNLPYGAAMCAIKYYRSPLALPGAQDAKGMTIIWKEVYNTSLGAGAADASHVALFQQAIAA